MLLMPAVSFTGLRAQSASDTLHVSIRQAMDSIDCTCREVHVRHARSANGTLQWEREVHFPDTGRFVEESHYVTTLDDVPDHGGFPTRPAQDIHEHLVRSHMYYLALVDSTMPQDSLYSQPYHRVWTPAEGGRIGQGALGDAQLELLDPWSEMWLITMMWAPGQRPEPGTRMLLRANGRAVVVVAGFETGPASEQFLGGVTPEVHAWLGTDHESEIEVIWLEDPDVIPGPVICRE